VGGSGKVTTDFGSEAKALTLVVQPDGKLVAAGYASADDAGNFALVRYNANGNMDSTFGVGGKVITDFGGPDDLISALIVQPDGKLVAAGFSGANFALARYQGGGTAATRTLTVTRTGSGSDPGGSEQRTFLTTDPIAAEATYYDSNETCAGANPVTLKFFVFNLEGQLILGRNRDTIGGVTNTRIGGSKYRALLATLAPGTLPPGAYNLVFMVEDCTATAVLVSGFYSIQVFTP